MGDFRKDLSVAGDEDFLQGAALFQDAVDGKCVKEFVGEKAAHGNAGGDFDGGTALPFLDVMRQTLGYLVAAGGRAFDSDVV